MPISKPTIGQDPWGADLNAALDQIGDLATNVTDAAYGAMGDGVTNDTTAVQAAITAVSGAGGGVVYFPAGTYLCSPNVLAVPSNVRIVGSGRKSTFLKKSSAGVLLSISGPSTDATGATHARYSSVENIGLNGNSTSGALLQLYYADNLYFREVHFTSNADTIVQTAEFWDSRFISCTFESSGGAADAVMPMVRLRNSVAASGFGFSADNTNNIAFVACRFEDFYNGAIRIEQGTSNTNNPNAIFITDCKMESSNLRGGSHLRVNAECKGVYVNGLYCFAGAFFSGYSTEQNIVNWAPQASELANVLIANGAVATVNSGVLLFSGAASTARLDTVIGAYTTAPVGSHIFYDASSTADFHVTNCYGSTGGQSGGTVPIRWSGQHPVKQIAGVPVDGDFTHTPLNGTFAIDTSAGELYIRIAGVWTATGNNGDVQTFTGSGTWTKPAGAKTVTIVAIGGGGGGGSGAREPSLTLSTGGAGGGGSAYTIRTVPASLLSATETVTVGAGGAGGTAITTNGTVGNPGSTGTNSVFKSSTFLVANAGVLGGGGTAAGAASGGAGGGGGANGGAGASSSATGGAGSAGTSVGLAAPGGGSGGGVTTVAAASAGGAGGNVSSSGGNAGGTAGTAGNPGGAGVSVTAGAPLTGTAGGGGGSATAAVGGTGGAGGTYGAGGGGGGASLDGSNSGAGGAGANGIVVVMTAS